jgi:septum formation protein
MKKLILASGSPRRKRLLENAGLVFTIVVSNFDEEAITYKDPTEMVRKLSLEKAKIIAKMFPDAIILGADTTVVINEEIIGKPKNIEDAYRILNLLNDRKHEVITGFTIISGEKIITEHIISQVIFRKLTQKEIDEYVKSGEPMDKAGGYGIQDGAGKFIEKVIGDYDNVVGLPVSSVMKVLNQIA